MIKWLSYGQGILFSISAIWLINSTPRAIDCTPRAIPLDYILVTRACPHLFRRSTLTLRNLANSSYCDQIFMHRRSLEKDARVFSYSDICSEFSPWNVIAVILSSWTVICILPWSVIWDLWKRPHLPRENDEEFRKMSLLLRSSMTKQLCGDGIFSQWRIQGGGGGGGLKTYFCYNFVVKMCFVTIYIQYSLTKYGFWSASEVI